jgi:pSer/pThr/pTyr-binding forkhead associated (FHA) protein
MPALLLTLLKFIFIAFIYLFVWQVARAVGLHVGTGETARRRKPSNQVVIVKSETQAGMDIAVRDAVVLGRSAEADIVLEDPYASEFHMRFVRQDGGIVLHDLGSTNGTYVNGRRVGSPVALSQGDAIQVGKTIMEVR